jgi:nitrite reductase/ring-hydroxylating ferredoxin subunit
MTRSPFPIPFGWFQVGWPSDIEIGETKPIHYFGRDLVLWRDEEGTAHVNDAFCPHLGAHLGHGGKVVGCEIACPFHGWRFNADGDNTLIPYSDRLNAKGKLPAYPVIERNGLLMVWYHPDGAEPMWEIPEFEPYTDSENFTEMVTRIYEIEAPWQELAENGVDSAHFRYVHNTEEVPILDAYDTDGPIARMKSTQKFPTPQGVVDGRIDSDSYGPGISFIQFAGIVDTFLLGCNTPIEANKCEMRFNFCVRKLGDDQKLNSTVGDLFVEEVHRQVLEDKPIWENKAFLPRPALADTDGPFTKFRKWATQFYADPYEVDPTAIYPPDDSYPATDVELTNAKKYGSAPIV